MSQITNHKLKIGIIGCGNMGSALVENLRKVSKKDIFVFDKDRTRAESLVNRFGVVLCRNINELKKYCGVFIIAVKPQDIDPVLEELSDPGDKLIISIAAGITLGFLETRLGKNAMI
ncbi:MAG TPA: NAD(P)-binding domain-containing protein, partial [Candidatus Omnitrophota bacterium]|nr:NAD(P)-binding domain-containing protein [Candidatus Omnitrophota bacterium]